MNNYECDIKRFKKYDDKIKKYFNGDYNQILMKNIKLPRIFFENIEDPFINNYLNFSFPKIMHKSFIEYDEDIYKEFLGFLKVIYKSQLLMDILFMSRIL